MLASIEFKGLFLLGFLRDWVTIISCSPIHTPMALCWRLPSDGTLKLNFDGASKGNPGQAGFRCV